MALVQYTDTGRTDMSINEKDPTQRVAPNTYYPRPILNPATHRMCNATYHPDRNLAFASNVHSTEPFYRSLPMKEQNLWWEAARENPKFRQTFDSAEARDLPVNFFCRLPQNIGKWPRLKASHSENTIAMCDSHGSTKSGPERKKMKAATRVSRGKLLLQQVIADNSCRKSLANVGKELITDTKKSDKSSSLVPSELDHKPLTKKTFGKSSTPGMGEILVAHSLHNYQKSRGRDINVNRAIQVG